MQCILCPDVGVCPMCRAARSEAEGWKARTLQAESHIAELKLQVKDYRMQLGLPIADTEASSAAPAALTWHKSDNGPEAGEHPVQCSIEAFHHVVAMILNLLSRLP